MKNVQKMLQIGLLAGLVSLGASVQAADDDSMPNASACMINVDTSKYIEKVNIQYIRNIFIKKSDPTVVTLNLASNYNSKNSYQIEYVNPQEALKGLETISDNIHNCRIKAQSKQNTSTKTIK